MCGAHIRLGRCIGSSTCCRLPARCGIAWTESPMRQTSRLAFVCRPKPSPLLGVRRRQEQEWGGRSLQELQRPHKSRLLREQEEWAERVCKGPASRLLASSSVLLWVWLLSPVYRCLERIGVTWILAKSSRVHHAVRVQARERTQADRAHTARDIAGREAGRAEFHEGAVIVPCSL
jgi:hypothetical protein